MKKQVIIVKCLKNGAKRVFENQEEAGEDLGVTSASISLACTEGRPTAGYLARRCERVYLVHIKAHDSWLLCVKNARGAYVEMGNPNRRVVESEYDEVRDITVGWYWQ